jgi:hypothetical protein
MANTVLRFDGGIWSCATLPDKILILFQRLIHLHAPLLFVH